MNPKKRGGEYALPLSEYEKLVTEVTAAGCFKRTYLAHTLTALVTLAGLGLSAYVITATDTLWIQLVNACVAAFFTVQLGLLGHDLSHKSVFVSRKANHLLALVAWNISGGISEGRWFEKHNAHHQSPNHIEHDPDVDIPFIFSHEQAARYSTFYKKQLFPRQEYLFWIGIWFVYPYNLLNSMRFLFRDFSWRSAVELSLMATHFIIAFGFTFWFLPMATAILFNLMVMITVGVYMAMIFAPNHKGEDMLTPEEEHNWVHQITLTRNLIPSPVVSYFFGGLDRQVEHHLFPTMSRFQYHKAQPIVKKFCIEKNIPYKETTWLESLRQIHSSLREEAQHWR